MLGSAPTHLNGDLTSNAVVHFLLVNQPFDTFVHEIPAPEDDDASPPEWNVVPDGNLIPWYKSLFAFTEEYLNNDEGMVVLMPCGLTFELHRLAQKDGMEVKTKWLCNQPEPLVHPQFSHMLVCSSPYQGVIIFEFNHIIFLRLL